MNSDLNRQEEKMEPMLDQIKELFFEFGIKNLNMDDISHKLGISKKTLYRFVKSKEDLISQVFEYEEKKYAESVAKIGSQNINAIEVLFKVSLLVYEGMQRYNPMLLFELRKYYEAIFNEFHDRRLAHISKSMRINLERGITEGLYRQDVNKEAVVAIYMNHLVDIHNSEMCKRADITFDELFKVMFENHVRAISTPEGVIYFEKRKKEITENLIKNNN